jgi:hypothetical protein
MNNFLADSKANSNGQSETTIDELARAVAQNALLNTEVDQKLAARLIETREELKATREALMTLRRQFETFTHGMAQVLESIGANGQTRNR